MWGNSPWVRIPLPPPIAGTSPLEGCPKGVRSDHRRRGADGARARRGAPRSRTTTCRSAHWSWRSIRERCSRRHNERELHHDPTAHAEILALRDAAVARGGWRLDGCALVVTVEPCPMCAGRARCPRRARGVRRARPEGRALGTLYNFGADPRLNHELDIVGGVRAAECGALIRQFFADKRTSERRQPEALTQSQKSSHAATSSVESSILTTLPSLMSNARLWVVSSFLPLRSPCAL